MNCFVRGFSHRSRKPRAAGFGDEPLVHEHHVVADLAREVQLVRDDHHRHPRLGEEAHRREHLADELGVESGRRLVEEHHLRVEAQRTRDRDALLLPARELAREMGRPAQEAHLLERARRAFFGLVAAHALRRPERERDVAERRQVREEVELLEHHPDLPPELDRAAPRARPATRPGPYSTPKTRTDPALGSSSRLIVRSSVDLPDPDGPKMTTCSPAMDAEVDAVEHLVLAERLPDALEPDDLLRAGGRPLRRRRCRRERLVHRR